MTGSEAAAWWQAIISGVAILASGAIAVFVPWNERRVARRREDRSRLDVDAGISSNSGLELLIVYRPEFHNHALSVSVQLVEPKDARLYRGKLVWGDEGESRPHGERGSLANNVRYHSVPLVEWQGLNPQNRFVGMMFVEYPDERKGPGRATIDVAVLVHGNRMIAKHRVVVSAMNVEFFPNGGPPIVIDQRKRWFNG